MDRFSCSDFELKDYGDSGTFCGYGAVFSTVDSHLDVIEPGAFTDTIKEAKSTGQWPAMLLQHGQSNDGLPVGVYTSMSEDSNGLYLEGRLALENSKARDAFALMRTKPRPALNGLSIGYQSQVWEIHAKGSKANGARRTLKRVKLFEVSLVGSPSNALARVSRVKSAVTRSIRDLEKDFLSQGFSHTQSKKMARAAVDDEVSDLLADLRDSIRSACR